MFSGRLENSVKRYRSSGDFRLLVTLISSFQVSRLTYVSGPSSKNGIRKTFHSLRNVVHKSKINSVSTPRLTLNLLGQAFERVNESAPSISLRIRCLQSLDLIHVLASCLGLSDSVEISAANPQNYPACKPCLRVWPVRRPPVAGQGSFWGEGEVVVLCRKGAQSRI